MNCDKNLSSDMTLYDYYICFHCRFYRRKMAPNLFGTSATLLLEASQQGISQEKSVTKPEPSLIKIKSDKPKYKWHIVWRNVIAFVYIHAAAVYGLYLALTTAKFASFVTGEYFHKF